MYLPQLYIQTKCKHAIFIYTHEIEEKMHLFHYPKEVNTILQTFSGRMLWVVNKINLLLRRFYLTKNYFHHLLESNLLELTRNSSRGLEITRAVITL